MPEHGPLVLDALETMRALFTALGQRRATQPLQSLALLPEDRGDFIVYPGALADPPVIGTKVSPYIVTADRPVITAWTLLMSSDTGRSLLLCDAGRLTTERTAATTALAVDLLARRDARRLAIIGAGPLALGHLRYAASLRDWSDIRVFSPGFARDSPHRAAWTTIPHLRIQPSARDCVEGADVVVLATSSGTPVIDPSWLGTDTLVTSISTNAREAHEVPPAFLAEAQVYCDDKAGTPLSAGEMVIAWRNLDWNPESIHGDLADLCNGRAPPLEPGRRVFFRSIGLGLEDIAVAHAVWRLAVEEEEAG